MDGSWSIGEFAALAGLPITTLHYYDRIGLVPARRLRNGHRRYGPESLETLEFIRLCQMVGCSLAEIEILARPGSGQERRALAKARLAEIDRSRSQLLRVRRVLEHLATCRHEPGDGAACRAAIRACLAELEPSNDQSE